MRGLGPEQAGIRHELGQEARKARLRAASPHFFSIGSLYRLFSVSQVSARVSGLRRLGRHLCPLPRWETMPKTPGLRRLFHAAAIASLAQSTSQAHRCVQRAFLDGINFFDFASGKKIPLAATDRPSLGLALSPDGTSILYVQHEWMNSSIMLVKNFR